MQQVFIIMLYIVEIQAS